jgi:phosphoglycerate dehydrogenase-like enzyme
VLAAVLSLARRFPLLRDAQARRHWQPLIQTGLPPELEGQQATVVGWGPVGQHVARYLDVFGLRTTVVRHRPTQADCDRPVVVYGAIDSVLPATDWLILACPLSEQTQGLISAQRIALLPAAAHVINVARGAVLDEHALVAALQAQRLAGAYLDVFEHEPLPADSPLWGLPNTLITPHSSGFSAGNEARVDALFLQQLRDWLARRA